VPTPLAGRVDVALPDAAVANPGVFWITIVVTGGGKDESYPSLNNEFELRVSSDTVSWQEAYNASL
jgi:hypothetical protein